MLNYLISVENIIEQFSISKETGKFWQLCFLFYPLLLLFLPNSMAAKRAILIAKLGNWCKPEVLSGDTLKLNKYYFIPIGYILETWINRVN